MIDLSHIQFAGVESNRPTPVAAKPDRRPPKDALAGLRKRLVDDEAVPLDPFLHWLLAQAAVDPSKYRASAVNRRLLACLRVLRATDPDTARQVVLREPRLKASAVSSVLIGVTEFFREPAVFEHLAHRLVPALARKSGRIRVLSMGVSGGQELYSLAMLLAEAGLLERSELVGMDCRHDAIAAAAAGRFSAAEIASMDARRRERFFQREGNHFRFDPGLQAYLRWRTADLFSPTGEGQFDLTFFRNVAIYFEPSAAEEAWNCVCTHVSPGGLLVTGRAERPPACLGLARLASCIYRKTAS